MALDALAWLFLFPESRRPSYGSLLNVQLGTEAIFLSMPGGFAGADVAKVVVLKKQYGIESADTAASLLARRWILGISQIIFVTLACVLDVGVMEHGLSRLFAGTNLGWIAVALVLSTIVLLSSVARLLLKGTFAAVLFRLLSTLPVRPLRRWLTRNEESFRRADECFRALGSGSKMLIAFVIVVYTATWVVEALETLFVARYLGLDITLTQILMIEAILSVVKEAVFFLPSGIVVKDLGYMTLFSSFGVVLNPLQTLTFVVVKRFIMLVWVLVGYALLLLQGLSPVVRRRNAEALVIAEQEQ